MAINRKDAATKWVEDIQDVLREDNVRELTKDLRRYLDLVTPPNEEAESALETMFNRCLDSNSPIEAMWYAFVLGAAWQKGMEEEGEAFSIALL